MSVNNFNTTDAVPNPPRIIIDPNILNEQKTKSPTTLHSNNETKSESDDESLTDESNIEKPKDNHKSSQKKSEEQKNYSFPNHGKSAKKIPSRHLKNTNAVTKIINVVNSSGVHVGGVYNYNLSKEQLKVNCADEYIPRTEKIDRLLDSRDVVNHKHIGLISRHMGRSWRDVGIHLGYSKGELDSFYEDNKMDGLKEVSYQILLDWMQLKADEAVVGDLILIIWNLGDRELVKTLSLKFEEANLL